MTRLSLTINSGETEEIVFTGEIDSIRRDFDSLRVSCINAGGVLSRFRPAETYENVSAATVIRNLLDTMGVDAATLEDGPDLAFISQILAHRMGTCRARCRLGRRCGAHQRGKRGRSQRD